MLKNNDWKLSRRLPHTLRRLKLPAKQTRRVREIQQVADAAVKNHDEAEHRSGMEVPHGEYTDASPWTKRLIDSRALQEDVIDRT
jgi:hypothetical protein